MGDHQMCVHGNEHVQVAAALSPQNHSGVSNWGFSVEQRTSSIQAGEAIGPAALHGLWGTETHTGHFRLPAAVPDSPGAGGSTGQDPKRQ